jgi:hypothetical protein
MGGPWRSSMSTASRRHRTRWSRGGVRPCLQVEQPADVVGVQMGADDVGDVVPLDPQGPEPGGKLAAEQAADGVLVAGGQRGGPHPRVDQNAPVAGAEKEAADREPGLAAAVEQVAVSGGGGVVAEVAGAGDERPVGDGAQLDAANVDRPRPRAVRRVRRPIQATDGSGRRLARRANQARRSGRACDQLGYASPRNANRPPSADPAPGSTPIRLRDDPSARWVHGSRPCLRHGPNLDLQDGPLPRAASGPEPHPGAPGPQPRPIPSVDRRRRQ